MKTQLKIPLKYKFLGVLIVTLTLGFTTFFALAYRTFSEDKKLFVMDLNLSILKTAVSDTRADLKSRIDELQTFLPKIYETNTKNYSGLYAELSLQYLPQELLGVRFYRRNILDSSLSLIKEFKNDELLENKVLPETTLEQIEKNYPAPLSSFSFTSGTTLLNRSVSLTKNSSSENVAVLTFLIPGSFVNDNSKSVIIVVDIIQDFLRKKLSQSELAEVFLVTKSGNLLSHSSIETLIKNTGKQFNHPITEKLKTKQLPRESSEVSINNESYLCNTSESDIPDTFAVSQIKKKEAFSALKILMKETLLTGILILSIAFMLSILFSNRLTTNIKKLSQAAEEIGMGNLNPELDVNSNDEIKNVSDSILLMTSKIKELISDREEKAKVKARMEEELKTAQLIQSTLLSSNKFQTEAIELEPFYLSASECGGDIWDAYLSGNLLTILVGDATGHGAPAAIVTAVAKSCFSTLNSVYSRSPLSPEIFLEKLNQVIYDSCKGQLLMTMAVIQIDLHSGETTISNAGHEAPLLLNAPTSSNSNPKSEPLFLRGERLGFSLESKFDTLKLQLSVGDTILIYTDGVSEAVNRQNKQFGERGIKKLFNKLGSDDLAKMKNQLYEELKIFMGTAPQLDDITYVLLRWKYKMEKIEAEVGSEPQAHSAPLVLTSSSQPSEPIIDSPIDGPVASNELFEGSHAVSEEAPEAISENLPELNAAPVVEDQPQVIDTPQEIPASDVPSINEGEQSVIRLVEPAPPEKKLSKTDLNQLAKKTDFADEEIDTHYSRLTELDDPDSGTSGGEAA